MRFLSGWFYLIWSSFIISSFVSCDGFPWERNKEAFPAWCVISLPFCWQAKWLVLTGDNITVYARGKGEMTCQHSDNKTCNCHISLLITYLYFCLFRAFFTLENPKEILKYIQELKADSTNFFSCRCFKKICNKIMGMTHINVCRGKHHSSILSSKYIYRVHHMHCLQDGRLRL